MRTGPHDRTGARPAHSAATERSGWGPTLRSRRTYSARRDGRAMTALRATAYVLTSLASVVFLALTAYGAVQFAGLQDPLGPLAPTTRSGPVLDDAAERASTNRIVEVEDGPGSTSVADRPPPTCATAPGSAADCPS